MNLLELVFSFLMGAAFVLAGLLLLPKMIDRYFKNGKKTFEICFRIDYYSPGSLYSPSKGQLIKSQPITVMVRAVNEKDALHLLDDIIKEETKAELVRIKEIKVKPEPEPKSGVMIAKKNP